MSQTFMGFPVVTAVGFSAATGAASANTALPNNSAGNVPVYVRVSGRNECYVKFGLVGVAATSNDIFIGPGDSTIFQVPKGVTHIGYIQGNAVAGFVNVVPLENS